MNSKTWEQNHLFPLNLPKDVKYALLILLDLANQSSLCEIADKYLLPKSYLKSICSSLEKAGLIKGDLNEPQSYVLSSFQKEITLLDVVISLESQQNQTKDFETYTPNRKIIHQIWQEARAAAQKTLAQYTIFDLYQQQKTYLHSAEATPAFKKFS